MKASSHPSCFAGRFVATTGGILDPTRLLNAKHSGSALVGDHPLHLRLIGFIDHRRHVVLALTLSALRSQNMALESLTALYTAGCCLLEALSGATVCLKFRHCSSIKTEFG